jgi:hypothetical protein
MSRVGFGVELMKFFYQQRVRGFAVPGSPHFDEDTSRRFHELLGVARLYLEFGCGGSTIAADRLKVPTISVESDPYYAAAVHRVLSRPTTVELLNARIGITRHWGTPLFRSPSPARLRRWSRYSSAPFERILKQGRFPDLVLIDGRFRRACLLETAAQALRTGSKAIVMFDDYYNPGREHYRAVETFVGAPSRVGRSAFFEVGADACIEMPTDTAIEEANADWR